MAIIFRIFVMVWSQYMSIKHESGGVLSSNHDWFHYNTQTKVWSRVLIRSGKTQGFLQQVSIQLTPPNGEFDEKSVEELKNCIIKIHEPAPSIYEKYTHLLPRKVYQKITKSYGVTIRNFLLDKDVLSYIDLNKLLSRTAVADVIKFSECRTLEPNKKGLIERLSKHPELYDMPYALSKHIKSKIRSSRRND